jgi:hypothetical protein
MLRIATREIIIIIIIIKDLWLLHSHAGAVAIHEKGHVQLNSDSQFFIVFSFKKTLYPTAIC